MAPPGCLDNQPDLLLPPPRKYGGGKLVMINDALIQLVKVAICQV
jgi:hypothetical protein